MVIFDVEILKRMPIIHFDMIKMNDMKNNPISWNVNSMEWHGINVSKLIKSNAHPEAQTIIIITIIIMMRDDVRIAKNVNALTRAKSIT